jgi:hypothetical protein
VNSRQETRADIREDSLRSRSFLVNDLDLAA